MNDKKRIVITFPKPLLKALRAIAADEERSIAAVVRDACELYIINNYRGTRYLEILALDLV